MIQIKYKMFPDIDPKNPRIGNYSTDGQWILPQDIFLNTTAPSVNVTATNASASNASLTVVSNINNTRIGHYDINGTWVLPPTLLNPESGNPHVDSNATLTHVKTYPDLDPKNPRIGNYTPEGKWVVPADIFLNTTYWTTNGSLAHVRHMAANSSVNVTNATANATNSSTSAAPAPFVPVRIGGYTPEGKWEVPAGTFSNNTWATNASKPAASGNANGLIDGNPVTSLANVGK
jgi:hypothetical protein